jgi:phosphoribosylaminoimidazolecarboxamide formyltransferase/IMP cyclohydrolase
VSAQFLEVLIAPAFTPDALVAISRKVNVRVLEIALDGDAGTLASRQREPAEPAASPSRIASRSWDMKRVGGGLLLQTLDEDELQNAALKVVTRREPTPAQRADLLFAWHVAKFVKSNAIVFCRDGRTVGVGAGQMSRVDSTRIAALKASTAGLALSGSVVASDAFFPFRDGLDVVADSGAVAVIQPGGSVRDDEVIAAADERGLAMVFTGVRHFRH